MEHFSKCHHLGKVQYLYFKVASSRVPQPYDLISVPKEKVCLEFLMAIFDGFMFRLDCKFLYSYAF